MKIIGKGLLYAIVEIDVEDDINEENEYEDEEDDQSESNREVRRKKHKHRLWVGALDVLVHHVLLVEQILLREQQTFSYTTFISSESENNRDCW
ncbi:hypothetical protein Scep_022079 [Stephania cephalantha]|uniref:Uncharacterized protein n=1 Tax=Stephania cephalantha TaxID=152367 RepID=A0AAP0F4N8_9MAGN